MTAWRYVCLTIDRYLCVAFYHNRIYHIFNSRKNLAIIFLILFAFISLVNIPNLFSYIVLDADSNMTCESSYFINLVRNLVVCVFRVILPTLLQAIFSVLLIFRFFKVRRTVVTNSNGSMKKDYRFARIILWLNLIYFITEIPYCLTTLYFGIIGKTPTYPILANTSNELAVMSLVFYLSVVFGSYLFGSLFFVNFFTNKLFQREIRLMFGRR